MSSTSRYFLPNTTSLVLLQSFRPTVEVDFVKWQSIFTGSFSSQPPSIWTSFEQILISKCWWSGLEMLCTSTIAFSNFGRNPSCTWWGRNKWNMYVLYMQLHACALLWNDFNYAVSILENGCLNVCCCYLEQNRCGSSERRATFMHAILVAISFFQYFTSFHEFLSCSFSSLFILILFLVCLEDNLEPFDYSSQTGERNQRCAIGVLLVIQEQHPSVLPSADRLIHQWHGVLTFAQ